MPTQTTPRPRFGSRPLVERVERRLLLTAYYTVENLNDSGPGSLRYGTQLSVFDVLNISFEPGLAGTIVLTSGPLELRGPVSVLGPGASLLTISGNHASRVIEADAGADVLLSNLTISDGESNDAGAGIKSDGDLTLSLAEVQGNFTMQGNGGGVYSTGTLRAERTTFNDNHSGLAVGGGIYNAGTADLQSVTFSGNSAEQGGAVYNDAGAIFHPASVTFSGNWTNNFSYGGAVFDNGAAASFGSCVFSTDRAGRGGGIYSIGGTTTVRDSSFTGEDGGGYGGGIYQEHGTLTVINSKFAQNQADFGAGIGNLGGTASISNSPFDGNTASFQGGALYNDGGTLSVAASALTNNKASFSYSGGAVYSNTVFTGRLTITNSTIAANQAGRGGGLAANGKTNLTNDTIFGNTASVAGGGILISSGTTVLNNTIVAGNSGPAPADISASVTGSNNLIGTGGAGGLVNGVDGNIVGITDVKLAPLGDYGGPTQTLALLPGSPALDAGSNAVAVDASGNPLTIDQRGLARVYNGTADIGAYEAQPPGLAGDVNHDGRVSFADLLVLAQHYGSAAQPLWEGGDLTGDGTVAFADLLVLAQNYGGSAAAASPEALKPSARTLMKHRLAHA